MSRQPLSRERICDALESCRPGSSDLFAADLADVADRMTHDSRWEELYERIQSTDLKISAAFQDVEIPPGLEQRLMASLSVARAEEAVSAALDIDAEIEVPPISPSARIPHTNRWISRRRLFWTGGILAVATTIFLAVFLGMHRSPGESQQTVLDTAMQYFNADVPAAPGQLLSQTPEPKDFPLSRNIRRFSGIRWRTAKAFMGHTAVAFDLPALGGTRATLYAVDCAAANLGVAPPWRPANTGGSCVAAWQENGLLYVLVVQGSQETYQKYLNLPATVA